VLAELDCEVPDPAGRARDEQRLTALQVAMVEQSLPGGQPGDGQRRRLPWVRQ
jgi:hypothetical protein